MPALNQLIPYVFSIGLALIDSALHHGFNLVDLIGSVIHSLI